MALRRVCDKCGKEKENSKDLWYHIGLEQFQGNEVVYACDKLKSYDICPSCFENLTEFLANKT